VRVSKGGTSGKPLATMVKDMEQEVWQIETEDTIKSLESKSVGKANGEAKPATGDKLISCFGINQYFITKAYC